MVLDVRAIGSMADLFTRLTLHAETAREQRLSGGKHSGHDTEFPLVGFCFDNAFVCWHILIEHGHNTRLVKGTTERVADPLIQDGHHPREFESTQMVAAHTHYWVEVLPEESDDLWLVDIASDSWETLGECLVRSSRPDDYFAYPDSYREGWETLHHARRRRCWNCGDHRFADGGCPECAHLAPESLE